MELLRGAAALPRHKGVRKRADAPGWKGGGGVIMSLWLWSYYPTGEGIPQERGWGGRLGLRWKEKRQLVALVTGLDWVS